MDLVQLAVLLMDWADRARQLAEARVDLTVVGGKIVYRRATSGESR